MVEKEFTGPQPLVVSGVTPTISRIWKKVVFTFRADPLFLVSCSVVAMITVCAVFPTMIAPENPDRISKLSLQPPSRAHLLGTDEFGRDILSRIIHSAQVEISVSSLGVALAVLVGVPMGLFAGYYGGKVDLLLSHIQESMLAFPSLLFAILVVNAIGASTQSIIITIGMIYAPRFMRLVRGNVLVLKKEEYISASRAAGSTDFRICFSHILPNCQAPVIVQISLAMSVAILIESGLSYLGLGVQPPTATWGTMLKLAQTYPKQAPWYVLAPGLSIFAVCLAFNYIGDSLRDNLDPRLH